MAVESRYRFIGDFRTARHSRLYWLDIDIAVQDIFFRQLAARDKEFGLQNSSSVEYCVLEGVGTVANALTVGRDGVDFDRFMVYISGYYQDEEFSSHDLRAPARMIWNKTDERSPRLDIYIPKNISRHLVELYVTKRIDALKLSVQIAVTGDQAQDASRPLDGFPLLGQAEHLYFRHVQCELLSVYTSIGKSVGC